jgi:hypothetical protein
LEVPIVAFPIFKASVKAEVAKVNKLLANADKEKIDLEKLPPFYML